MPKPVAIPSHAPLLMNDGELTRPAVDDRDGSDKVDAPNGLT